MRLLESPFDLAVIGAGLTGSAVARDAALRGLRVLLVDQADLGGVSAPPLSVLPTEGRAELQRLHALAPHLVRPHRLVVEPAEPGRRSARWSARLRRAFARHDGLRRGLFPPGLPDAVPTWGRVAADGRLALALARSAHDAGAWVLPWMAVEGLVVERARVQGLECFDRLSGTHAVARASVVVDATGPWTDRTRGLRGPRPRLVEPGRRAAISLSSAGPAPTTGLVLAAGVIALPHGGRTLVLGAEVPHQGDFDAVAPSVDQVERLQGELARAWPQALDARPAGAWAGLVARPALDSQVPCVVPGEDGLISVVGGTAGGHRALAEEALEAVARSLRADGVHVGGCLTAAVPLPGGEGVAWKGRRLQATGAGGAEAEAYGREQLPPGCADHLLSTYGGRWHEVAALAVEQPELAAPLVSGLPLLRAQVSWALAEELVCSLPDLLRRLDLPALDLDASESLMAGLAAAAAAAQGWSAADTARQIEFARAGLAPLRAALGD